MLISHALDRVCLQSWRINTVQGCVVSLLAMTRTACHCVGHSGQVIARTRAEKVAEFKYTGMTQTEKKHISEQIYNRLNSGNADYRLVLILHLCWRCKQIKIEIRRTIILPAVWFGCETWSLTLMGEHWLRVFENGVLRKMFGPYIFRVTTQWTMRWAGHEAYVGEQENFTQGFHRKTWKKEANWKT